MIYNSDHVTLVLGHMLKDAGFAAIASRLEPQMLQDPEVGGTRGQSVLFLLIKRHLLKFSVLPDMQVLVAEFRKLLQTVPKGKQQLKDEFVQSAVPAFLVTPGSKPLAQEIVQFIARKRMLHPAMDEALREASVTKSLSGLQDRLAQLALTQDLFTGSEEVDIVGAPIDASGERMSTFIPWLDSMFGSGRGMVQGSTIGIIANQGGGKTTFGIALGVAQALSGKHAHIVLVEEGATRSMRCKLLGAAVGVEYAHIDAAMERHKTDPKGVAKAVVEVAVANGIPAEVALRKMVFLRKYLKITDAVANQHFGLAEILTENDKLLDQGHDLAYMYLDWAGILAARMLAMKGHTGATKESVLKHIAYEVSAYAQRKNISVAISQQMSPLEADKGPFASHNMYCAADCKGFTEPMKYVFTINPKDKATDLSLLQVVKSRDDVPNSSRVLHLQGQYPKLIDVSDNWEQQRKKFVRRGVARKSPNAIPSEE